jgi:hypothetical protein
MADGGARLRPENVIRPAAVVIQPAQRLLDLPALGCGRPLRPAAGVGVVASGGASVLVGARELPPGAATRPAAAVMRLEP